MQDLVISLDLPWRKVMNNDLKLCCSLRALVLWIYILRARTGHNLRSGRSGPTKSHRHRIRKDLWCVESREGWFFARKCR